MIHAAYGTHNNFILSLAFYQYGKIVELYWVPDK